VGFQTPQYKLATLLEDVGDGTIQLPDFQRGYKWDEERIRSLLVTIMLGYPLGVIMLLETGGDHVRFQPKPIEGGRPAAITFGSSPSPSRARRRRRAEPNPTFCYSMVSSGSPRCTSH